MAVVEQYKQIVRVNLLGEFVEKQFPYCRSNFLILFSVHRSWLAPISFAAEATQGRGGGFG